MPSVCVDPAGDHLLQHRHRHLVSLWHHAKDDQCRRFSHAVHHGNVPSRVIQRSRQHIHWLGQYCVLCGVKHELLLCAFW